MAVLEDGSGTGREAKVDALFRLNTNALSQPLSDHYVANGHAYNVNTGNVTLTSANESALLYLKNNEDEKIVVTAFIYLLGNSDQSGGDTLVQVLRNPTAGTIIDNAVAQVPVNRDFGSSNTLTSVLSYKGVEGDTLTDGTIAVESLFSAAGRQTITVPVVLEKGNSIGITYTPQTSNTSQTIQIAMAIYLDKDNIL